MSDLSSGSGLPAGTDPPAAADPSVTTNSWPDLPLDSWKDTCETLHRWTQIAGKVTLALALPCNHYWNIAMHLTARGLSTPLLPYRDSVFTLVFDFVDHQLVVQRSDGGGGTLPLKPRTVADFYREVMALLERVGIHVPIRTMPVEIPDPIPFQEDVKHRSYDPERANAFWRLLVSIQPVFESFRGSFLGKCSPVHFFWGSFDLAVTRFSGRAAPERPGADPVTRESYSHEVISHGFWPGNDALPEPAFYAYAAPEPEGLKDAALRPPAAYYNRSLSEFILPYAAVRGAASPSAAITDFLETTYEAAAELAHWNRAELERR